MTETGTIKVLDFGVAKIVAGAHGPLNVLASAAGITASSLLPAELTLDGALVGTVPYMSPEQWGADTVDHRTDIWAVGIMLYRMVVGRHPVASLDGRQLMVTAVLEQPIPSAHNAGADMPPELADIIDACLKKRKAERMPSAKKLLAALERLLPGQRPIELHAGDNPYAGLNAFQEADAGRFRARARSGRWWPSSMEHRSSGSSEVEEHTDVARVEVEQVRDGTGARGRRDGGRRCTLASCVASGFASTARLRSGSGPSSAGLRALRVAARSGSLPT